MRIALLGLTHPFRGGIAHYTTLLCRALRERHDVRFFALSRQYPSLLFPGKTQIDESESSLDVEHESTVDSINPLTWLGTGKTIARDRPDLLLISWWHPFFAPAFGTIARRARRLGGVPACFLCHNALPHERSRIDGMLLRYAFGSAASFITHSSQDRDDLIEMFPDAIVRTNPHPTYDVFQGAAPPDPARSKRELNLEGRFVVLFFGYVRAYKGLDHLLEAMRRLDDDRCHLLVVGEFYENREKYAEAIDTLERAGRLSVVDRYVPNEEVPGYFAAADLVAVPYLSATQSGVVQIAYAFRKPVVATRVGGLPEVIEEDRTGYLVPPGDADALASAIRRHLSRDDVDEMQRAIDVANEAFSWDRMVDTVEKMVDR